MIRFIHSQLVISHCARVDKNGAEQEMVVFIYELFNLAACTAATRYRHVAV